MDEGSSTGSSGFQVGAGVPDHYERHVAPIMQPFVEALVRSAEVQPGAHVLDVACGTGFATRALAAAVGPQGAVAAIDVNPRMLATARDAAPRSGARIDWREGSALDLPWDDDTFDAVVCQQGLQFLPDPVAGLAEMGRVARRGRRVAATVWAPVERSPYFREQMQLLIDLCGLDPAVRDQAFPPGASDGLKDWARSAGLLEVHVRHLERRIELPAPLEGFIHDHLLALPWAARCDELDPATREQAIAEMAHALASFVDQGTPKLPFASFLVTATAR